MSQTDPAPPAIVFWPWDAEGIATAVLARLREQAPDIEVIVLDHARGFGPSINEVTRSTAPADLVIIADACGLPEGWADRLRAAAYADDTIAAATALCSDDGHSARTTVGSPASDPVHPRVSTLDPGCVYVRRSAIGLLGDFDEALVHPRAVLSEFAARALGRGLSCALADDVVARRLPGGLSPCPADELETVVRAHPWIEAAWTEEDALEVGPRRRSLVAARVAARGPDAPLSVTIDARALGPGAAGTQTYVGGLALALAQSGRALVRAVVRDEAPGEAIGELEAAGIELVRESRVGQDLPRTDIAHRPQQAFVPEDLRLLRRLGERVVITHLDLISYRDPAYHESADEWRRYRRLTRVALASCDRVVFLSDHARRDAIAEDLIEPEYATVCGVGVQSPPAEAEVTRPGGVAPGAELVAMIGADYEHKNRRFAIELLGELRGRGWDGALVLAGAHVVHGGSAADEAALLRARPELAAHVFDVGQVSEPEKRWLLRNVAALLCPSTYEGFGLIPLEAAAAGIPCAYAAVTSLREVTGSDAATLVPWNAAASAQRVLPLLGAGKARDRHLASLRAALERYRWKPLVERLERIYRETIASPYRSSVPRSWEELEREQMIVALDDAYHELRERTEHGRPLIDERGGMLSHDQQRGLMRIAARGWLRRGVLGPIGALGRTRRDDGAPSSR